MNENSLVPWCSMIVVMSCRHSHQHLVSPSFAGTEASVLRGARRPQPGCGGASGCGAHRVQGLGGGARGLVGLGTQITGGGRGSGRRTLKLLGEAARRGQTVLCVTRRPKYILCYALTTRRRQGLRRLCLDPVDTRPGGGSPAALYLRLRGCCSNATHAFVKVSLCR